MTSWNSSAGTVAPRRAQSDSEFFKRPAAPKVTTRPREVFRSLRDQPDYASRHLSATSDLSRGSSGSGSALPKKKSSASAAPGGHSVRSVLANIHHEQEKDLRLAMERQRAERSQLATQLTGVTTKQRGPAFNSTSKMSTGKPYVATGMTLKSPSSSGTGSGVGVRKSRPVTGRPDVMRGREAAAATLLAAARSGGGARPSTAGNISSGLSQMEQDDLQQYGGDERVPTGYVRKKLLGKGGCAAVWLASGPIGDLVALKQVAKAHGQMGGSAENSARAEIEAAALLAEVSRMPGHSNIISLHACEETRRDIFCVFEIGGKCLTKHLFEMKGEFSNGARIYRIVHQPFYLKMKSSIGLTHLRDFLRQMFSALEVLRTVNIVHADIKPENILVRQHENGAFCAQLCDFGSSTVFQEGRVGVATPEYMPPEILKKNSLRSMRQGEQDDDIGHSWSYDVWSLGALFLEMVVGAPLWLSYKARVVDEHGKSFFGTGLFAAGARDPDKIIVKQADALKRLPALCMGKTPGICLAKHADALELLESMLTWDAADRIRPDLALDSPFLA